MKRVVTISLIAWMLTGHSATGGERMSPDEVKILSLEQSFIAAWNRGDAHGATALFAEDGVRVGAFGDVSHGRKEIEAAYEKLLHGPMSGASVEWLPGVRMVSGEVAIAEGPMTIHPPGDQPAIQGYAVDIWRKSGGKWQLIEAHPRLFPRPLGSGPPQSSPRPDSS